MTNRQPKRVLAGGAAVKKKHKPVTLEDLPVELFVSIIILSLPEPLEGTDLPTSYVNKAALTISSVSRAWRSIALETPLLWSRLSLDMRSRQTDNPQTFKERSEKRLQLWDLAKSRTADIPLDIHVAVDIHITERFGATQVLHAIQDRLVPLFVHERHRWKRVNMWLPLFVLPKFTPPRNPNPQTNRIRGEEDAFVLNNLCSLQVAFLHFFGEYPRNIYTPFHLDFSNSGKLERLECPDDLPRILSPILRDTSTQFRNLTTVNAGNIMHFSFNELVQMLGILSHSIQRLEFRIPMTYSARGSQDHIEFPRLTHLQVYFGPKRGFNDFSPNSLSLLLSILVTPSLEHLANCTSTQVSITKPDDDPGMVRLCTEMTRFLQRSKPPLKVLSLKYPIAMPGEALNELLEQVPLLTELCLFHMGMRVMGTVETLTNATTGGQNGSIRRLCPRLQKLSIIGAQFSSDGVIQMLRSRRSLKFALFLERWNSSIVDNVATLRSIYHESTVVQMMREGLQLKILP